MPWNQTRFFSGIALVAMLLLGGCGGGSGPAASSPAPVAAATPPPDYTGNWEGAVRYGGQQLPITFRVDGQQIASLSVDLWVTVGDQTFGPFGQSPVTCNYQFSTKAPATLNGGSFEAPVATTTGIVYRTTVKGSFSSGTAAAGTIDAFLVNAGVCKGRFVVTSGGWSQSPPRWEAVKR